MTKSVASPTGRVEVVEVQAPDGGKPPPPDVPTGPSPHARRRRRTDRHRVASESHDPRMATDSAQWTCLDAPTWVSRGAAARRRLQATTRSTTRSTTRLLRGYCEATTRLLRGYY